MPGYRLHKALSRLLAEDLLPQRPWRVEVLWPDLAEVADHFTDEFAVDLVQVVCLLLERNGIERGQVSRASALVEECHLTVALEVSGRVFGCGLIHGQLLIIGADTVSMGVGVGEEDRLHHASDSCRDRTEKNRLSLPGIFTVRDCDDQLITVV